MEQGHVYQGLGDSRECGLKWSQKYLGAKRYPILQRAGAFLDRRATAGISQSCTLIMSSYKYGSLQETEIRVLRLFSGQPNSDLQGALITHQLLESDGEDQEDGGVKDVGGEVGDDVGSEYTALSYTWGDAKPKIRCSMYKPCVL